MRYSRKLWEYMWKDIVADELCVSARGVVMCSTLPQLPTTGFNYFFLFPFIFLTIKLKEKTLEGRNNISFLSLNRRLYSYVLRWESTLCKTPHFQWIYGKLNQIYEKLRSDQMDPKSALGGPKPISRTGGSLLKNWSYTSNQCIQFGILLYWRPHLAKTLFILHKYIKCALL